MSNGDRNEDIKRKRRKETFSVWLEQIHTFCRQPLNLKLGPSIAMCLESPEFETRRAYELNKVRMTASHFLFFSIWRIAVTGLSKRLGAGHDSYTMS